MALAIAFVGGLTLPTLAQQALTVVGAGGALQDAERKAFFEPFAAQFGVAITEDTYTGEIAKVRAMVTSGQVTWDVLQVDGQTMVAGCAEGLFEKLDWDAMGNRADFLPGATTDCGAGAFAWGFVTAHDEAKTAEAPQTWAEFFDLDKFPGKRGVRGTAILTLESALLADNVSPDDIYEMLLTPEGVDRAFAKLDTIKSEIVWWNTGAESIERLVAGDVVYTTTFNGRVTSANDNGANLGIVWNQQIYGQDFWAIVKGTPNLTAAQQFVQFTTVPEVQSKFPEYVAYGVLNNKAIELVSPEILAQMPTAPANTETAIRLNDEFWGTYGEDLEQRFKAWQAS